MKNIVEHQILFSAIAMIEFTDIMKRFTYIYQIYISSFKLRAMYIMNRPFDTSVICFVQNQDLLVFAFEQQNIEQLVN